MKRTRKWSFVEQEARRLVALRLTPREIASRLGVSKSTVTRWMQAGKIGRTTETSQEAERRTIQAATGEQTPAQWAKDVRSSYDLDATDDQMVTMAETTLLVIRDPAADADLRLKAMGRFQALVKQLALVARVSVEKPSETPSRRPVNPTVRRPSVDPRSLLTAVK